PVPGSAIRILELAAINYILTYKMGDGSNEEFKIDEERIREYLESKLHITTSQIDKAIEAYTQLKKSKIPREEPLAAYTKNLTYSLDQSQPAWEREELLRSLALCLNAHEINNILVLGPAGCGKSRLAEGLSAAQ